MKIVLKKCNIMNPSDAKIMHGMDIVMEDGLITSVGIVNAADDSDKEINCSDKFIIPGLINLHTHIQRRHLARTDAGTTFRGGAAEAENLPDHKRLMWAYRNGMAEISEGVTTIRDCGSKNRISIQLRDSVNDGISSGPRILACGFGIAAPGGHETHLYQGAVEVRGEDQIRQAVRTEYEAGADLIKFMGSGGLGGMPDRENPWQTELTFDEMKAGVDESHKLGLKATVHAMGTESIRFAAEAGIDCIEHGVALERGLAKEMAARGTALVPTVSGITNVMKRIRLSGRESLADEIEETVVRRLRNSICMALEEGVKVGTGTDTLGILTDEIKMLHELGMSKTDALKAATADAAAIMGLSRETGSIKEGMAADMVILRSNPFDSLDNLSEIESTIVRGRIHESYSINQILGV